jgi:hypothetical protein
MSTPPLILKPRPVKYSNNLVSYYVFHIRFTLRYLIDHAKDSEDEMKKKNAENLHNIFVVVTDQVISQSVGILMGINCAPTCFNIDTGNFIQKLLKSS